MHHGPASRLIHQVNIKQKGRVSSLPFQKPLFDLIPPPVDLTGINQISRAKI
jgi:hypothetical protein